MSYLKKILFISFVLCLSIFNLYASEKNIIKVTENIKYLSQNTANNYLYLYNDPKKVKVIEDLKTDIKKPEDDFRFIAKNTNDADTKNVLDFLSYSKDQMKEILEDDVSKESVLSMLDLSDTLLEGANSILDTQKYKSFEPKFHLMMISKLYMAINLNINKEENKNLLNQEIKLFKNFSYNKSWLTFKEIVSNKEKCFVPNIISILVKDIKNSTGEI